MKRSRPTGFTIVELLMGMFAGAIVLLGTTSVLVGAHKSWHEAWKRMNLQNDAAIAMRRMAHTIRPGTSVVLSAGGQAILVNEQINGTNRATRFFLSQSGKDLQCQVEDNAVHALVSGTVQSLTFTKQNNLIGIQLTLQRNNIQTTLATSIMLRNTGGITTG